MASILEILINVKSNASKNLKILKQDLNAADASTKKLSASGATVSSAGIVKLSTNVKKLAVDAKLASASIKKFGTDLRAIGTASVSLGTNLAKIGAVIALPVVGAVVSFAKFEKSMQRVLAISGASTEEFKLMGDEAKRLGASTEFSAAQAAEGLTFLAQAGLSASESTKALSGVLNLATAGGLDLATAADLATNVLAGFKLGVEDLTKVNDVLAATSASANTNVQELAEGFKITAPIAAAAGISIKEVAAVLGAMANNGIKGAEGGNAFKRMIVRLQAPTAKAAATLQRLGVSVTDASGEFRGMRAILEDLNKAQLGAADASRIFGVHTVGVALAAVGATADIAKLGNTLLNVEGAADTMAETMRTGVTAEFNKMTSALNASAIALGNKFAPVVNSVLKSLASGFASLQKWVDGLGSFGTSVIQVVAGLGVFALVLAAILIPLGLIISGIGIAVTALAPFLAIIVTLGTVAKAAALGVGVMGSAISLLTGGVIILAISKIAELVGLMFELRDINLKNAKAATDYQESITKQVKSLGDIARANSEYRNQQIQNASEVSKLNQEELQDYRDKIAGAKEYYLAAARIESITASINGTQPNPAFFEHYKKLATAADLAQKQIEILNDKASGVSGLSQAAKDVVISFNSLKKETGSTSEALEQLKAKFKGGIITYKGSALNFLQSLKDLEQGLQTLVDKGDITSTQMQAQLNAINTTKTVEELNILKEVASDRLLSVQQSLKLVEEGIASLDEKGFNKLKGEAKTLTTTLESIYVALDTHVEPAFETLGITSQASLQKTASEALLAFETIRDAGTSAPKDVEAAFLAMALSHAQANNEILEGELRLQLLRKGIVPTLDGIKEAQEKLTDKSVSGSEKQKAKTEEATDKVKKLGDEAKSAGDIAKEGFDGASESIEGLGENARSVSISVSDEWVNAMEIIQASNQGVTEAFGLTANQIIDNFNRMNSSAVDMAEGATKGMEDITTGIKNGTISLTRLEQLTKNTGSTFNVLNKSKLDSLKSQIKAARDSLVAMTKSAKGTLSALRSQLAGLNGDRLRQAALANEQKTLEIQGEIDLAKARGNGEAVKALTEALTVQRQIYQVQQQQIVAEEQQATANAAEDARQEAVDARLQARDEAISARQAIRDQEELSHDREILNLQNQIDRARSLSNERSAEADQQRLAALQERYRLDRANQDIRDRQSDADTLARANFATGGYVAGAGTGTSDSIPANLSNGEFVVNAQTTSAVGADYLYALQKVVKKGFGALPKFATGGRISGEGTGTSDSILARLSNGEFVMNAKTVSHFGENFFNGLQGLASTSVNTSSKSSGSGTMLPAFASGGSVGSSGTKQVEIKLNVGGQTATGLFDEAQAEQFVSLLENVGQVTS